jgi:putative hydroxymethylpyrimidine transporter CytX
VKTASPPEWGIEPVPDRLRLLGTFDTGALWGNLGISLLLPIVAAFLVPGLSLAAAALAIAVGVVLGNLALGYAGRIGAETGAPAMVLYRPSLGLSGSYIPSALNILQNIGWGAFELFVIGTAAAAITSKGLKPVWIVLFGAAVTLMAVGGPLVVVRQWIRRFAVWAVLASSVYLTVYVLGHVPAEGLMRAGTGGSFWQGVDLVIAMPISWIPLVQDYTRFSRTRRAGFWGTAVGYGVAHAWFYMLGVLLILSGNAKHPDDPVGFIGAVLAIPAGVIALAILAVDETDEAFANVYSASVSTQNLAPRASQRKLSIVYGAVCIAIALAVDLVQYENFLLLIGAVFVPLFGVLAADYAIVRRGYTHADLYGAAPRVRAWAVAAWATGFIVFNWINPGSVGWWVRLWTPLPDAPTWLGASIAAFVASFALQSARALVRRERAAS